MSFRPALCITVEVAIAIAIIVIILALAAHAAPEPWQMGCKIRTGIGVVTIVLCCGSLGTTERLPPCGR
jgi:hypothetical protein